MRHDIPGGWAELCEPEEVTERARRPISYMQAKIGTLPGVAKAASAAVKAGVTDSETLAALDEAATDAIAENLGTALPLMDDMNDLLIIARLREWSFELPHTVDALLDLPQPAYAALKELCASTDGISAEVEPTPDPKASTPNSNASPELSAAADLNSPELISQ